VHHQYNDVNNQQGATTFSFINHFKSALHVSGDKFAHPQEHFCLYEQLLVPLHCTKSYCRQFHLNRGTGRQQCRCIVPKATASSSISTVAPVGSSVDALYQKLFIQSKFAPEDGRICRPKHVGLI